MASGIEKLIENKIKGFLQESLGITPEDILQQIGEMQKGVQFLFAETAAQKRKMDALLLRAGFTAEQIEALNKGPDNGDGNGSGAGSPANQYQRIGGPAGG